MDFSNLTNLYNAQQKLTAYNTNAKKRTDEQKDLADVNGDGKIDSKDRAIINKSIKEAKSQNLFDFNNDDKVDINDWVLFSTEVDLDGDGEISTSEKKFLESQQKTMKSAVKRSVTKDQYTGEFDNKMYQDGKLASGEVDGKYYQNGVLKTGSMSVKETDANGKTKYVSYYFVNGEKANGTINNYLYKDGLRFTGLADDGLYYTNGKPKTGTVKNENTTTYYKKGEMQYSVTDKNGKDYPSASGQNIKFSKSATLKLETGSSAVINKDGTVEITDKDGNKAIYDKDGNNVLVTTPEKDEIMPSIERANNGIINKEDDNVQPGSGKLDYEENGYNKNGYDEFGYNKYGYDKSGNPARYTKMSDFLQNFKNAEITKNEDGSYSVTIPNDKVYTDSAPSVIYNFDTNENLLSYTFDKGFDEATGTRQKIEYDKFGNVTGGTITTANKTINLPSNSEVNITPSNDFNKGSIDVVTNETYNYTTIYNPTDKETKVYATTTTKHYDLEGNHLGTNITQNTGNPKAKVSLDYSRDSNGNMETIGGAIGFENGQIFDVPAGAKVSYSNGKIYVTSGNTTCILGDNGLEDTIIEDTIITIDEPAPVIYPELDN